MAAAGAMWVKPSSGPLAGKRVVLTKAQQKAFTKKSLHLLQTGGQHSAAIGKKVAHLKAVAAMTKGTGEPKKASITFGSNTLEGKALGGMIVHAAKQPGEYALTVQGSKKTVGHFKSEADAIAAMKTLAKDDVWKDKLASGNLSDSDHAKVHSLIYEIKGGTYVQPVHKPAPAWNPNTPKFSSLDAHYSAMVAAPGQGNVFATPTQKAVISSYKDGGYSKLNAALWGPKPSQEALQEAKAIDEVINASSVPWDCVVFRGQPKGHPFYQAINATPVGGTYKAKGFDSASLNVSVAHAFGNDVTVEYRVPKGFKATAIGAHTSSLWNEMEVLMPRDVSWKVVGKTVTNGKIHAIVEPA